MKYISILAIILFFACSKKSDPGPPVTVHLTATVVHSNSHLLIHDMVSDSIPGVTILGNIHYEWWYHGALVDSVNYPGSFPFEYNNDETQRPDWPYYHTYPDSALSIQNVSVTEGNIVTNYSGRQITVTW